MTVKLVMDGAPDHWSGLRERQRQKQQHCWLNGSIGLGQTGSIGVLRLRCAVIRMTALWGGWSCTTSKDGNPPFSMRPERMATRLYWLDGSGGFGRRGSFVNDN